MNELRQTGRGSGSTPQVTVSENVAVHFELQLSGSVTSGTEPLNKKMETDMKKSRNILKANNSKKCIGKLRPKKQAKITQCNNGKGLLKAAFAWKAKLLVVIAAAFLILGQGNGSSPSA